MLPYLGRQDLVLQYSSMCWYRKRGTDNLTNYLNKCYFIHRYIERTNIHKTKHQGYVNNCMVNVLL